MFALEGVGFLDQGVCGLREPGWPGARHLKMNTAPCWQEAASPPEKVHVRVGKPPLYKGKIPFDSFNFSSVLSLTAEFRRIITAKHHYCISRQLGLFYYSQPIMVNYQPWQKST